MRSWNCSAERQGCGHDEAHEQHAAIMGPAHEQEGSLRAVCQGHGSGARGGGGLTSAKMDERGWWMVEMTVRPPCARSAKQLITFSAWKLSRPRRGLVWAPKSQVKGHQEPGATGHSWHESQVSRHEPQRTQGRWQLRNSGLPLLRLIPEQRCTVNHWSHPETPGKGWKASRQQCWYACALRRSLLGSSRSQWGCSWPWQDLVQ